MMAKISARARRPRVEVVWGLVAALVLAAALLWIYRNSPLLSGVLGSKPAELAVNTSTYNCNDGKTITAAYYAGDVPQTGDMPQAAGRVSLVLDDGRKLTLPQTISGSGVRYANSDESVVFWSKGNTAFVEEGADQRQTYSGCVTASALPGQDTWNVFASSTMGFSIRYPQGYSLKTSYAYAALGPGKKIPGVKFIIPPTTASGTNLALDSGVSVEVLLQATTCSAAAFLPKMMRRQELLVSDNGVDYVLATSSDAAAGNRYEELVYALKDSMPCTAVRYFIHYGNIQNYPPPGEDGSVNEFDRAALIKEFDQIRESLVLGR